MQKSKSRLTDSIIEKLQNYFGIALRSKVNNVKEMRNAILALASMFHVASSADCNYHTYCPKSNDSWCQYNRDIVNRTNLYRAGAGLSVDVVAAINQSIPTYLFFFLMDFFFWKKTYKTMVWHGNLAKTTITQKFTIQRYSK